MNKSDKRNLYEQTLINAGHRMTEQRRILCDYLSGLQTHPTAYDIFGSLAKQHPDISRATVYNTLNTLKELGAIVELSFAGDQSRYETDPTPHINMICLRCHSVTDYDLSTHTQSLINNVKENVDFEPLTVRVEFVGFCADCRNQRKNEIHQQWLDQQNQANQS